MFSSKFATVRTSVVLVNLLIQKSKNVLDLFMQNILQKPVRSSDIGGLIPLYWMKHYRHSYKTNPTQETRSKTSSTVGVWP